MVSHYTNSRFSGAYSWTRERIAQYIREVRNGSTESYIVNFLLQHKQELFDELSKDIHFLNDSGRSLNDKIKSVIPEDLAFFMRSTSAQNAAAALDKFTHGVGVEGDFLMIKDHYDFYGNQYIPSLSQEYLDSLYKEYHGHQAIRFLLALSSEQDRDFVSSSHVVPNVAHDPIAAEKNKRTEKSLYSIEFLAFFLKKYGADSYDYLQGLLDRFPHLYTTNMLPQFSEEVLDYFRNKYQKAYEESKRQ